MGTRHRPTERHLPYGITQCYLPTNTDECALTDLNPRVSKSSIYLPTQDGC